MESKKPRKILISASKKLEHIWRKHVPSYMKLDLPDRDRT